MAISAKIAKRKVAISEYATSGVSHLSRSSGATPARTGRPEHSLRASSRRAEDHRRDFRRTTAEPEHFENVRRTTAEKVLAQKGNAENMELYNVSFRECPKCPPMAMEFRNGVQEWSSRKTNAPTSKNMHENLA